ncbi:hypothetical protein PGTUg99_002602 [Puccinia graminis f. sp. tritici]|uniref:Uncharacterized protein n=1 Tax=Puccinia graminis f. sp. tritici TaxID=56615 RepID=A0A5B0S3I8_PUCGR|nr:hypothetical protein PGTUg99_002602 [Puccinia graminis f. sp. tritici]
MSQPQNFTPTPSPAPSAPCTGGRLAIAQPVDQLEHEELEEDRLIQFPAVKPSQTPFHKLLLVSPLLTQPLTGSRKAIDLHPQSIFSGTSLDEDNEDPQHQTQSDEERLPDAPTFDWGAPPAEAQNNATGFDGGLIGELREQLHFSESNLQLVNQLLRATDKEKWGLTVMFFVHSLGKTTAKHVDNGALPTLATSTRKFAFPNHVKILTKGNVEAYTCTMTLVELAPIRRTPILMLKASMMSSPYIWHHYYNMY